jgi:hypothetical protein
MVVSNEDEPITRGRIIGFQRITQARQLVPLVRTEDGREVVCFSLILPYNAELKSTLERMPYKERFDLLSNIVLMHSDLKRLARPHLT